MNKQELLYKILTGDKIIDEINTNIDILLKIIPEINSMIGFEHKHPHHHLNVWQHTLCALDHAPNNFDIRLILLLHDIGKPFSFQEDDNIRHYEGHPEMSALISNSILNRLKYKKDYINYICEIISKHDTMLTQEYIKENTELAKLIFEVQKCDVFAHNPNKNHKRLDYLSSTLELFNNLESNENSIIL